MFEALWSIILGIIGNLLTPPFQKFFSRWLNFNPAKPSAPLSSLPPSKKPVPAYSKAQQAKIRAHNRERFQAISGLIFLYVGTAVVLYGGLAVPMYFKVLGGHGMGAQGFNLVDTRLGWDVWVPQDSIKWVAIAFAALLYLPLLLFAQRLAHIPKYVVTRFYSLKPLQMIGFVLMSFCAIALFVSGHCVFLLYPKLTYGQSLLIPFVTTIAGIALAENHSRRPA